MPRIPLITNRSDLASEYQHVFDAIHSTRGAVRGPFTVLLHRPELAAAAQQIGAYLRYESELPGWLREGLTLITARLFDCDFEWAAHVPPAMAAGLGEAAVRDISIGRFDRLDGDLGLVAELAKSLVETHGVDDDVFARARQRWTDAELVELVTLVGYYSCLARVLNAFEVRPDPGPVPKLTEIEAEPR
jgi:4-carboxymuconolactone decarboxylase